MENQICQLHRGENPREDRGCKEGTKEQKTTSRKTYELARRRILDLCYTNTQLQPPDPIEGRCSSTFACRLMPRMWLGVSGLPLEDLSAAGRAGREMMILMRRDTWFLPVTNELQIGCARANCEGRAAGAPRKRKKGKKKKVQFCHHRRNFSASAIPTSHWLRSIHLTHFFSIIAQISVHFSKSTCPDSIMGLVGPGDSGP